MEQLPLIAGWVLFIASMILTISLCVRGWLDGDLPDDAPDPYAEALGKDGAER